MTKFYSPLYLPRSYQVCYKCDTPQKVVTLAGVSPEPGIEEDFDPEKYLATRQYISSMPAAILGIMQERNSRYTLAWSPKLSNPHRSGF